MYNNKILYSCNSFKVDSFQIMSRIKQKIGKMLLCIVFLKNWAVSKLSIKYKQMNKQLHKGGRLWWIRMLSFFRMSFCHSYSNTGCNLTLLKPQALQGNSVFLWEVWQICTFMIYGHYSNKRSTNSLSKYLWLRRKLTLLGADLQYSWPSA